MNPEPSGQSSCVDMLIIGAGFGGICMGIKAKAAGLDVLILERANDIGGTWRENIYPGCACDTQSHHYSFSFFMKSDWWRRFAGHAEILEYLHSAVDAFDLRDDNCLNHAVRAIHFIAVERS
ncbi:MAG: NAD(P)-binding protein [Arenicellales bacterium]